jgi:hypothetical protein
MLEAAAPTRQQFDEPSTSPVVVMRNPIAGPLVSNVTHHAAAPNSRLTAAARTTCCPAGPPPLVHATNEQLFAVSFHDNICSIRCVEELT